MACSIFGSIRFGAWCLGIADEYVTAKPASAASVTVYPNLSLRWEGPISPDERLLLEMWALEDPGGTWRLDAERAFAAIEGGHDMDALRKFLAARDDQPLPETVEGFLRRTERDARALSQVGPALLVECASAEIADRIAADKRAAQFCLRAGETPSGGVRSQGENLSARDSQAGIRHAARLTA